jgi:uncharacterized protein
MRTHGSGKPFLRDMEDFQNESDAVLSVGDESLKEKKERLIGLLGDTGSLLVAYSGGVDSTLLLALAHETLGPKVVAATAVSEIFPSRNRNGASEFVRERGIEHVVFESHIADLSSFLSNSPDRCYHCKKHLFQELIQLAEQRGIKHIAHGANMDDLKDYRPGMLAAKEMGIISPLIGARLSKKEIRRLLEDMGLSQWDGPATVCLASRIPYGSPITSKKLKMVDEAEAFLLERGIGQCRVRHHGSVARIELPTSELPMIMKDDSRRAILQRLREIGFVYVAVDMDGYMPGSMNRVLGMEDTDEG